MDKVKCGVIRDLMPLVVDEVATGDSVELVNAHMETCESCRSYYEGMTAAIARMTDPAPEEDKAFIRLGKRMKNQTRLRKWLTRALAALLALVIIVVGYAVFDNKTHIYGTDMDIGWADVQLYYEPNGEVAARIDMRDGYGWYNCLRIMYSDGIVYLMPMRPEWTLFNKGNAQSENAFLVDLYWQDGKIVQKIHDGDTVWNPEKNLWEEVTNEILRPVYTVRWGTMENYTTLYMEGETLPSAAEVMSQTSGGSSADTAKTKEADAPEDTPVEPGGELDGGDA